MYICTCNSITKHVYFPRGIVVVTASYPEIIGHSVRVITVRGKTNQRREGVSSQYLLHYEDPNTDPNPQPPTSRFFCLLMPVDNNYSFFIYFIKLEDGLGYLFIIFILY